MVFDQLSDRSVEIVHLAPGTYEIPDRWTMRDQVGKRVISDGLVRFVGRFIMEQCIDVMFLNCSFRAPVSHSGRWRHTSYDAVTVIDSHGVQFVQCSAIGGTDETFSFARCSSCGVHGSIVGGCFEVSRNHDMAMLVECDDFRLTDSVITGADRRKPQVREFAGSDGSMLISGNRIECGRTMTVGLNPQDKLNIDIVNNVFSRTRRTKVDEVEATNGSAGVATAYFANNFLAGSSKEASLKKSDHLTQCETGFSPEAYCRHLPVSMLTVGPKERDSWDHHLIRHFGSGRTWKSELDLPAL